MKINKGDIILLCILIATLMFFAVNEFNILAGLSQFDSSFTTLFGAIFAGELLSFAIYKIGMAKYEGKKESELAKYEVVKNNMTVNQIEQSIDNIMNTSGKHTKKE